MQVIGEGQFGVVYRATIRGRLVAIKVQSTQCRRLQYGTALYSAVWYSSVHCHIAPWCRAGLCSAGSALSGRHSYSAVCLGAEGGQDRISQQASAEGILEGASSFVKHTAPKHCTISWGYGDEQICKTVICCDLLCCSNCAFADTIGI